RAAVFRLTEHPERLMDLPPREALALIGRAYMSIFRVPGNIALFRIVLSEAMRFPQIGEMFYKGPASRLLNLISAYLQHQVDLGRLRPHDTMIAGRSFVGMFVVQVL